LSAEFEVRPYAAGDEGEIVPLLEEVFGGWPHLDIESPMDYWRWKYLKNPLGKAFIVVASSDGRIIGCHHSVCLTLKLGGDVVSCISGADLAVHPDFRGMGVGRRMDELFHRFQKETRIGFAYWITGNPKIVASSEKEGHRFPLPITNQVRIRDIGRQLREMPVEHPHFVKIGYDVAKQLNRLKNAWNKPRPTNGDLRSSSINTFDERMDRFWNEVSSEYDFIIWRGRDFLNWKYHDRDCGAFEVRQATEGDKIVGYCVLRVNRYLSEYPIGYVVDLLTYPDELHVADALMGDAVRYFDDHDVNIVNYQTIGGHPHEAIARRHGFVDSRIRMHMFYTCHGEHDLRSVIAKSKTKSVLLSWGDHDVLPVKMP
jgi:GNAT superfamily N-acetyltransferase